jgi:hypothetical protein
MMKRLRVPFYQLHYVFSQLLSFPFFGGLVFGVVCFGNAEYAQASRISGNPKPQTAKQTPNSLPQTFTFLTHFLNAFFAIHCGTLYSHKQLEFSHKQLVLVTKPRFYGAFFFTPPQNHERVDIKKGRLLRDSLFFWVYS